MRYTAFAGTYKSSFAPFRSDFSDPSSSTPNVLIVFASLPSLSRWQRQSLHLLQHTSKQAPRQMALRQQQPVVASMTIPQRRLERQLLAALTANLTDPRLEENRVQAFLDQLKTRLDAETRRAREAASLDSQLKEELAHLNKELANLVDAIASAWFVGGIVGEAIFRGKSHLPNPAPARCGVEPKVPEFTIEEVREFLRRKNQEFANILAGNAETSRAQAPRPGSKPLPNPANPQRYPLRENPHFTSTSKHRLLTRLIQLWQRTEFVQLKAGQQ